jgi:pyrimidine-nucleoside phosphorylase
MRSYEDAHALAQAMVSIGRGMGKEIVALITDMEQPLGHAVGNALETIECLETLKGRGPRDLESLSLELSAWMILLAGKVDSIDAARARVRDVLTSGAAFEKFREVVALKGGAPSSCDDYALMPHARQTVEIRAESDGRVKAIGCRAVGHAAMLLGAGRETADGPIDPAVGIVVHKKIGDRVIEGEPILTVHVNDTRRLEEVEVTLRAAIRLAPEAKPRVRMVRAVIDPKGNS